EWAGWSPIFDTQNPSGDGVGVRWTDEGTSGLENAARAASSTFAWRNKGWMVATEISNGSKPFGDARAAQIAASSCADLGAKGWFLRLSSNAELPFLEAAAADTSLNSRLAAAVPSFVFYPENARFLAEHGGCPLHLLETELISARDMRDIVMTRFTTSSLRFGGRARQSRPNCDIWIPARSA